MSDIPLQLPKKPKNKSKLSLPDINLQVGAGKEQNTWTSNGVINNFSTLPILVENTGELIYSGVSLHESSGQIGDSNYSITIVFLGTKNLQFDFRVRRFDINNFIFMRISFLENTVSLIETINGVENILNKVTYPFNWHGLFRYNFEISMLNNFIYGLINGFNIVRGAIENFRTEPGFSLYFPTIESSDKPQIYNIFAVETVTHNSPSLPNDPNNLYLQYRLAIKEATENPSERTWESYDKAVKFYENRNVGVSDEEWENLGYPIKEPNSAEWFTNIEIIFEIS